MKYKILNGDSADKLKDYDDNYFDSIVCDPPKCSCGKPVKCGSQNKWLKSCGDKRCQYESRIGSQRKPREIRLCQTCGEEIIKIKFRIKERFCSKNCANIGQTKLSTHRHCVGCGSYFKMIPTHRRTQKYCNQKCHKTHQNLSMIGNLAQCRSKTPTKPEKILYDLLDQLGWDYDKQVPIMKWVVDAYVPDQKLIIQADGDYWHGNPIKYKPKDLDKRQRKRIGIDKSQNIWFEKNGYQVLRIWEEALVL